MKRRTSITFLAMLTVLIGNVVCTTPAAEPAPEGDSPIFPAGKSGQSPGHLRENWDSPLVT